MLMKINRKRNQKGFTLIELMIVIAIIGILAAIAIPQFQAYRERGFIASMQADTSSLRTAEEAYFADKGVYTIAVADLGAYGFKNFSAGNSAVIAAVTDINKDFKITTTSTKTTKSTVYDSTLGTTVTN